MTHVWTNGSQWNYLLIQPHYFTSIKYVSPDRSLRTPPPKKKPNASQQHTSQQGGTAPPDFLRFSLLSLTPHFATGATTQEKRVFAISLNGSTWATRPGSTDLG